MWLDRQLQIFGPSTLIGILIRVLAQPVNMVFLEIGSSFPVAWGINLVLLLVFGHAFGKFVCKLQWFVEDLTFVGMRPPPEHWRNLLIIAVFYCLLWGLFIVVKAGLY